MITRATFWRVIAVALTLTNPLLHKPISDACDWVRARWGFSAYDRIALVLLSLVTIAPAALVLVRNRAGDASRRVPAAALVLVCLAVTAQRWLLVANIELVHFPQYALLSAILIAAGFSAPAGFLLSTAAGATDEAYQHLVIYAGRQDTYFDINDIVLNAIGAAWGVVLVTGWFARQVDARRIDRPPRRRRMSSAVLLTALAMAAALWWDPPRLVPFLRPTLSGHAQYRVLSTAEGVAWIAVLWALTEYATTGWRERRIERRSREISAAGKMYY